MNRIILLISFFLVTPLTLVCSLFLLFTFRPHQKPPEVLAATSDKSYTPNLLEAPIAGVHVFASLPPKTSSIESYAVPNDARTEITSQYLARYNSPLTPFASKIVQTSDKYNLDYRLIVAIAQQESNLCKKIPEDSFNCWGWGIHSQGTLRFTSYEEAMESVSKGIKQDYIDKGLTTPEQIMSKYTPLSNGSWAFAINQFLQEMQ